MTTPGVNGPHTSSLVVDGEVIPATWFTGGRYNTYDGAGMPTPIGQDALVHWITTVNASANNGGRVFEPLLNQWKLEPNGTADGVTAATKTLLDTTLAIRSDALFILRIHVSPDVPQMMVGGGADGKVHDSGRLMPSPASDEWVPKAAAGLIGLLEKIDELYPGKIIGVHMASLCSGEWSQPLPALHGWTDYSETFRKKYCAYMNESAACVLPTVAERNVLRTGTAATCGTAPNKAAQRSLVQGLRYHLGPYLTSFSAPSIPPHTHTPCTMLYLVAIRMECRLVLAIRCCDQFTSSGLQHDARGPDLRGHCRPRQGRRAATDNKLLTLVFYGYVLAASYSNPYAGSPVSYGHLSAKRLLESPHVDGFVGSFPYVSEVREVTDPLEPSKVYTSLAHHNMLLIIEDDTRTAELDPAHGGFKWCSTLACNVAMMRRDMFTTAMNSRGIYQFDLSGAGWYGKNAYATSTLFWAIFRAFPSRMPPIARRVLSSSWRPCLRDADWCFCDPMLWPTYVFRTAADRRNTSAIWTAIGGARTALLKATPLQGPLGVPAIAVFVDERAPLAAPLGPQGAWGLHGLMPALGRIGANARQYYADDLPTIDWRTVKLAIFPNLYAPSTAVKASLAKWQQDASVNTTFLFIGPSGLMQSDMRNIAVPCVTDVKSVAVVTGIPALSEFDPGEGGHHHHKKHAAARKQPDVAVGGPSALNGRSGYKSSTQLLTRHQHPGNTSWTVENNTDFLGAYTYSKMAASGIEECAQLCVADRRCVATSWNGPQSRQPNRLCNFVCSAAREHRLSGETAAIITARAGQNLCGNPPPPAPPGPPAPPAPPAPPPPPPGASSVVQIKATFTAAEDAAFPGIRALNGTVYGEHGMTPLMSVTGTLAAGMTVLGNYAGDTTKAALIAKGRAGGGHTIYSAANEVPSKLLAILARASGAHIFCDGEDCDVQFGGNALMIHAIGPTEETTRSGVRVVTLPEPLLVTNEAGDKVCATACATFKVDLLAGNSELFIVETPTV